MEDEADPLADVDIIGPGDEDTFAKKRRARARRTQKWIDTPCAHIYLSVAACVLWPAMDLLALFFEEARFQSDHEFGITAFCDNNRSPTIKLTRLLMTRVQTDDHPCWAP
eukprot:831672-Pyramimonas_sp.AAC.1